MQFWFKDLSGLDSGDGHTWTTNRTGQDFVIRVYNHCCCHRHHCLHTIVMNEAGRCVEL